MRNRAGTTTQTAAVVNPAGGLGPRITTFDEPLDQVTADSYSWGPGFPSKLISTTAASVSWATDDGKNSGDATGGSTDWGFTWNFGTAFSTTDPWVKDGAYQVQVQAKDGLGVPGEAEIRTVYVNRHQPGPVTGFAGSYNKTHDVVDLRWDRYDERDLVGYVVKRDGSKVCPASGVTQETLTCVDTNVPGGTHVYTVYAVDCENLKTRFNCAREGDPSAVINVDKSATTADAPSEPTGLSATVVDGLPKLTWTAPSSVPAGPIRFYRIYRDGGTLVTDRYDETVTSAAHYTDPNPGNTTAHWYWVTAVDQNYTESAPSAPVLAPPVL